LGWVVFAHTLLGQVSGNINYQTQLRFSDQNIHIGFQSPGEAVISVKGMSNVEADSYVAIFNVTQVGKTTMEVNRLIDERISRIKSFTESDPDVVLFVDMVSFVPVYEYEVEKKIFSKKTYNEVPKGFELKKNLHVKYADPDFLNTLIAKAAEAEIYDLVRVDYISDSLEQKKRELREKAKGLLLQKVQDHQELQGVDSSAVERDVVDGFRVVYPVEMYKSYQAYNNSSLELKRSAKVSTVDKTTTLYYQPIMDKEFDFVINPVIVEPVIQVMYEVKLRIKREQKKEETKKEYFLITPAGEVKNLRIGG